MTSPAKQARDRKRSYEFNVQHHAQQGRTNQLAAANTFTKRHNLECFKCGLRGGPWHAAKQEPDGRRWALCHACRPPTSG